MRTMGEPLSGSLFVSGRSPGDCCLDTREHPFSEGEGSMTRYERLEDVFWESMEAWMTLEFDEEDFDGHYADYGFDEEE